MKKLLPSLLTIFILAGFAPDKERIITGTVTDGNHALPNAIIATNFSKNTATTNEKGEFSITVSEKDTELRVSYIGYVHQQIKIGKRNTIAVILVPDSKSLNEIVIAGYSIQKKSCINSISFNL